MAPALEAAQRPLDRADEPDVSGSDVRFQSEPVQLWGWGEALRIDLPAPWPDHVDRVGEALAAIEVDGVGDWPGCGPVAFGALPFRRDVAAQLVVPAVIVGIDRDGRRWRTTIGAGVRTDGAEDLSPAPAGLAPGRIQVEDEVGADAWCSTVAEGRRRIQAGALHKVVLARRLTVVADRSFDARTIADRLHRAHPRSLRFLVDGFVGASPELLVSRAGEVVRAEPMAGTTARTGDPAGDQRRAAELLASEKNRIEHQITIDSLIDDLVGWCSYLDAEPEPHVAEAGPVQHLATMVEGRLSSPPPSVLELVAAVHPTPAVGGWPRDAAVAAIEELEPHDRDRYAGPVGWVDAAGNGTWAVGIRSVIVDGSRADVWAGVGVVADSEPEAELEETRSKLAATLGSVVHL